MNVYEQGRALAIKELAPVDRGGKGQIITLTYTYTGEYDEATGTAETLTYVQECSGVEVGIKAERVNGTSILTGDAMLKLSPVRTDGQDIVIPPDTAVSTKVTLANMTAKAVVAVEAKAPAGLLIALFLQVRG